MSPQGHMIHTRLTFKIRLYLCTISKEHRTQNVKVQYRLQLLRKYLDVNLGKHV